MNEVSRLDQNSSRTRAAVVNMAFSGKHMYWGYRLAYPRSL